MSRKITIEPVTRVEGHGKVTIHIDDLGNVYQSRLHIVEFRGFERFVQGRPYWEMPVLVQRLCGICPVSHHLAAAKALDVIVGAGTGEGLTPTGEKMRRLMHYGQMFQSHSLHFFHLASPDMLFGIDGDPLKRNIIGVALEHKDLAVQGVMMRKFGQEIIQATAGKKIHGTGAIPGGINKHLSIEASHLSLVRKDGAMDLYHGVLRAIDKDGNKILHDVDYQDYLNYIDEEVRSWSYMKFPYLKEYGKREGWYTVGPLARCNTVDFIPTPLAQKELEQFKAYTGGKPNNMSMHMHWARLIEILHSAEMIKELLLDDDLLEGELVIKGNKTNQGIGVIEAPRGTLFHHYEINGKDQVIMANLIVSTTNNNQPMNEAVNYIAKEYMTGQPEITEGMMNAVEVGIRAYDPCLSCATHAFGQMPLEISLFDAREKLIDYKRR